MTDNEFIELLDSIRSDIIASNDEDVFTVGDVLALINRKDAEIETLNVELVGMRGACESYKMHYDNAQAEIERLQLPRILMENKLSKKEIIEMLKKGRTGVIPTIEYSIKRIDEDSIKADAIKEFAERLKDTSDDCTDWGHAYVLCKDVDNLVKEMVGDEG